MNTSDQSSTPTPPAPRRPRPTRRVKHHAPWWGAGDPPEERWPGVSLRFETTWSSARQRWETHDGGYYFDEPAGRKAERFFPLFLVHHIGEFVGEPFELRADQALLFVRPVFGWKRTRDGLRRFGKVFYFAPKGYGKSPLAAGIGIYLARYDDEPAAEVYAVAADTQQARIVHENAKVMVEGSDQLFDGATILKNAIVWEDIHSGLYVLSSDAKSKHGFRPHGVLFDEMHAQPNRDLYETLARSMAKRRQPLMIIITHAGTDTEGICYEEYDLAKRVLQGNVDLETVLPVIFEMRPGDNWQDPEVWKRVNPGHGTTVKHEKILEECREAIVEPRKRNDFLRYHGNHWTSQATAWIPIEWWDACQGPIEEKELADLECAGALDLAQKWDLACFCVVFRRYLDRAQQTQLVIETGEGPNKSVKQVINLNYELIVRPFFWIPEDTMVQHEREDGVPYGLWAQQGLVTPTEGVIIDNSRIYRDITEVIVPRYPRLRRSTIGYDPAFATDLSTRLRDEAHLDAIEILQNYKMLSEPSQIIEALIKGKRVRHDGHRVLRWNWSNVTIKTDDAGRIRPVKPKQRSKRIDGAVAMIMGEKALSLKPRTDGGYQLLVFGGKPGPEGHKS